MFNRQEIFDKVARHLITQGKRSHSIDTGCRYRLGVLSCAIGCLISDEAYNVTLEGNSASHPDVTRALRQSGVAVDLTNEDFLSSLQYIHDNQDPADWQEKLTKFAVLNNLTPFRLAS